MMVYIGLIVVQVLLTIIGVVEVHSDSPLTFYIGIAMLIANPFFMAINIVNLHKEKK